MGALSAQAAPAADQPSTPQSLRRIEASGLPWLHKPLSVAALRRWLNGVAGR